MLFSIGFGIALVAYLVRFLTVVICGEAHVLLQSTATNATLAACEFALRIGVVLMAISAAMFLGDRLP